MTYKIVVTDPLVDDLSIEKEVLDGLEVDIVHPNGPFDAVLREASDADAILNTYVALGREELASLEKCRIIARYGIGVDNIDLVAAKSFGIAVTNVPDYCIEEVATHTLALILTMLRRLPESDQAVRAGEWGIPSIGRVRRTSACTAGLIGSGRIGGLVAEWLTALGMRVLVYDPFVAPSSGIRVDTLDELLTASDIVSLHCPLTPETRGLIAQKALNRMRQDAILINVSRGGLVNSEDLLAALKAGTIGGAALDVFEKEPPQSGDFTDVPNLLLSPHTAFYSEDALEESRRKAAMQVRKALIGASLDYRVNV